jgi:hypothetical protein
MVCNTMVVVADEEDGLVGAARSNANRSWLRSTSWVSSTSRCSHRCRRRLNRAGRTSSSRSTRATRPSKSSPPASARACPYPRNAWATGPGSGSVPTSVEVTAMSSLRRLNASSSLRMAPWLCQATCRAARLPGGATHRTGPGGAVAAARWSGARRFRRSVTEEGSTPQRCQAPVSSDLSQIEGWAARDLSLPPLEPCDVLSIRDHGLIALRRV